MRSVISRHPFALIAFVLGVSLCGCQSVSEDFSAVRAGMDAKRVRQLCGKPDSIDSDGKKEYWNYIVRKEIRTDNAHPRLAPPDPSLSQWVRPQTRRFSAEISMFDEVGYFMPSSLPPDTVTGAPRLYESNVYVVQFSGGVVVAAGLRDFSLRRFTPDGIIQILSIDPLPIKPGKQTQFTIKLRYSFKQAEKGVVQIAFNSSDSESFRVVSTKNISGEKGELEVTATVVPRKWNDDKRFKIMAILREGTETEPSNIITHHTRRL